MSHARLLEAKIALEAEIAEPVQRILKGHVAARLNGQIPNSAPVLQSVLLNHYARTVMVVTGRRPPRTPSLEEAVVGFIHGERLRHRARLQTSLIVNGLERLIARHNSRVGRKALSSLEGRLPATEAVIETKDAHHVSGDALAASIAARAASIANANTNGVAEEARFAVALQEAQGAALSKSWLTVLDPRVRPAHYLAEGQTVSGDRPFDVWGEPLMYPGDMTLGATLGNVINCRCSADYTARRSDGSTIEISALPRLVAVHPADMDDAARPLKPTPEVRLDDGVHGSVILDDLEPARLDFTMNTITLRRGGEVLGWATASEVAGGHLVLDALHIADGARGLGIDGLIARSIAAHNKT